MFKDQGFGTDDIFSRIFGDALRRQRGGGGGAGRMASKGEDFSMDIAVTFRDAYDGGEKRIAFKRDGVREELSVKIPAGIESGAKLRVPGRGAAGRFGGPSGDLYLTVTVGPDPLFLREGADIVLNQEIPYSAAALGGSIDVATMEGAKRIKVPAGIQSGTKVRLKGLGFPQAGGRGDMYVRVAVQVPEKLTARQRELVERLAAEGL